MMHRFVLREEFFGGLLFDRKALSLRSLDRSAAEGYANRPDTLYLKQQQNSTAATLCAPTKVFMVIVRRCNLRCSHCLNESGPGRIEMLSLEDITDTVHRLGRMGVFEIGINGGEPLLHPDFSDIISLIKSEGLATFVNTNGVLGSHQLSELIRLGVDTVKVSIDGLKAMHDKIRGVGTFERAMTTVRALRDADTHVHINLTLSALNVADVFGLIELADSLQCNLKIAGVVNVGRARFGHPCIQVEEGRRLCEEISAFLNKKLISISVEMTEDLVETDCQRVATACNYQYTLCGNRRVHMSIDTNEDVYTTGRQTHFGTVGAIGNIGATGIDELWRAAQSQNDTVCRSYDKCLVCDSGNLLFESFNRTPNLNWWR